ncbi:MAG: helix-turn-helix domain-containing protein [Candidatus Binatus sp.]
METVFLRVREFAEQAQISRSMAYILVRRGVVPSRKFGNAIRIPREALEAMAREALEKKVGEAAR